MNTSYLLFSAYVCFLLIKLVTTYVSWVYLLSPAPNLRELLLSDLEDSLHISGAQYGTGEDIVSGFRRQDRQ